MNETWLAHHGILGQRWGVRRFQNKDGTYTSAGKKRYGDKDSNKEKFWTDERKKLAKRIAIGTAAVAGIALASYGTYKLYQNGKLDPVIDKFRSKGENSVKEITGIPEPKSITITPDNAITFSQNINPSGSKENCGSVASAIIDNTNGGNSQALDRVPDHMRPVRKDGSLGNGYDPNKLIECYDGAKWSNKITDFGGSRKKVTEELEKQLLSQGEGAKGIFYCEKIRGRSSGHYFCYAITGGKVHVLEGQPKTAQKTGIDWHTNLYEEVGQLFDLEDGNQSVFFAQLNNCPLKPNRRKDVLKERE